MKKIFSTLILIISAFLPLSLLSENSDNLKIERVTVYIDGAEIHSGATIQLEKGRNKIVFNRLSQFIDPATIQIAGDGIKVLSLKTGTEIVLDDKAYKDSLKTFDNTIINLENRIREKEKTLNILNKEERILTSNQKLIGEGGFPQIDLKNILEYYFSRINVIENQRFITNEYLRELKKELEELEKQKKRLIKPEEKQYATVSFLLDSDKNAVIPIELRYWITQVGWFPGYDIFAREGIVEISYNANIYQQTGIDWESVLLEISSATVHRSQSPPRLTPYYLNFLRRDIIRRDATFRDMQNLPTASEQGINVVSGTVTDARQNFPLPGANVIIRGTTIGTVTDINGKYSIQLPSDARMLSFNFIGYEQQNIPITSSIHDVRMNEDFVALEDVIVIGYGSQQRAMSFDREPSPPTRPQAPPTVSLGYQTSFAFQIEEPYDILSSVEPSQIEVNRFQVPANLLYKTVPKIEEASFLTAQIHNWEQYNLLDGEANLYLDNQFMGRTVLETRQMDDTLSISLGRDDNIIVKRERQREYEQQRRFLRNSVIEERMWQIAVRNNKNQKILLELLDQVPVSQHSDIKVMIIEKSDAKLNEETGLLQWELVLQPGETKDVIIHYSVEYPKNKRLTID